jgi:hypothetical protein
MSMMRLLSAGKSLVGSRDLGKQYRMTEPGALPKFGSKNKATRGKGRGAAVPAAPPGAQVPAAAQTKNEPSSNTQHATRNTQHAPHTSWFAKLKSLFSSSKPADKLAIPRFSSAPIQCELSLDNVKVLRNDLSDTDFEVIAKPVEPEKPKPVAAQTPVPRANREKIWDRVTTLLGAGQT